MSEARQTRIGLPRALLYHKYAPMWTHFFRALGCQVIISPETNRQILETGTRYSIDESCLAVKIYLGHVQYLLERTDYIFIPRIVSLYKDETLCVKLWALADIVRNTFTGVNLLEYTVDIAHNQSEFSGLIRTGLKLTRNPLRVLLAYRAAKIRLAEHREAQIEHQHKHQATLEPSAIRVLLVAHPYVTRDALLGKTVSKILREQGAEVVYADIVDTMQARSLSTTLSADMYWSYNRELLGAIAQYKDDVDGIVFLMTFPCGPDALTINLCQNTITDVPQCVIVMDELQGDAGLKTRLESFVDILCFKKEGMT